MLKKQSMLMLFFLTLFQINAQLKKSFEYKFDESIVNVTHKDYNILIQNGRGLNSLIDKSLLADKKINSICVSPLGNQILIVSEKKVSLFNIEKELEEELENKFEFQEQIKKIVSDTYGENYFVLTMSGSLFVINNELKITQIISDSKLTDIDWSINLSSLYGISEKSIYNLKTGTLNKIKEFDSQLNTLYFSTSTYEVNLGDIKGSIYVLNQDFDLKNFIDLTSKLPISSIASHKDDPHLFVSNSNGEIFSINKLSLDVQKIDSDFKSTVKLFPVFTTSGNKKNEYIISYATNDFLQVWDASSVEPDFKVFIANKLEEFKETFFEIRKDESDEDFNNRTSPLTASKIFALEEQRLKDSIAISFVNGSPSIELEKDSISVFINPFERVQLSKKSDVLQSYLKVEEVHYEINDKNKFYIKNLKVSDKLNNSVLAYNPALDQKIKDSLDKAEAIRIQKENEAIALAKEISKQELELKESLTDLVENLKNDGKINEVDLSVESRLVKEKDSTGTDELNLKINFISKGVKAQIGANTSDYPPGKYNLFDSPSAKTLVEFFLSSTEENLIEYLNPGTRVTFKLTGSTDNSGITSSISYEEEYGVFKNFPYYFQGSLNGMNLNSNEGITKNSQLGFLRTYSVRDFISNYTDLFDSTKNKFIHYSEEANKRGAEFRKIQIEMTIHSIDKLMSLKQGNKVSLSDVDIDIPSGIKKVNGYALVIGNEDYASYQSDLDTSQNVPFASKDAESFKNYLNLMYGIPNENIILLVNATYGEMSQAISKFKKLMEFDGQDNKFVFYYSGHGMPHEQTNDPYIMPVDISGYTVDQAISLNSLLSDFKSYNYDRLTMVLDACFSGVSRSPEPLIKVKGVGNRRIKDKVKEDSKSQSKSFDFDYIIKRMSSHQTSYSNPNIGENMILISSSSGEETSLTDNENKHGLFTYYFLKFLKESNGDITLKSLFEKTRKKVGVESIMKYNKPQTPELLFGKNIDAGNDQFLE